MNPGRLQKSAEPLQAPRTTDSDDRPHDRREIPRCDHDQVPLRHARESSQPRSSRPAGVADMSAGSLRELASQSRELPASLALRPPSRVGDGPLFGWSFVCPAALLRRSALGDGGPHPEISGERHDLRRVVALVGDDRLKVVLHSGLLCVHGRIDRRVDDRLRVVSVAWMDGRRDDDIGVEIDGMHGLVGQAGRSRFVPEADSVLCRTDDRGTSAGRRPRRRPPTAAPDVASRVPCPLLGLSPIKPKPMAAV